MAFSQHGVESEQYERACGEIHLADEYWLNVTVVCRAEGGGESVERGMETVE